MITQLWLRGKPIGKVKGVLFDKDGTLSNSEEYLINLANRRINAAINMFKGKKAPYNQITKLNQLLLSAYGLSPKGIDPDGILAIAARKENLVATATVFSILGDPWFQALNQAKQIFSLTDDMHKDVEQITGDIRGLLPGALDLLTTLDKANVKCAVISNDTSSGIQSFLNRTNLQNVLKNYWSAEDSPPKPNPKAVKALCEQIGLSPNECALIGDADTDLNMAKEAGISLCLGYVAGWSTPPKLTSHEYLIHHWDELSLKPNPKVETK